MCNTHCIEAGGCSQPPHKGSQPPQTSACDSTLLLPPPPALQPLSIPPALHTTLFSPSLMDPAPVTFPISQQIVIDPSLLDQEVPSIPRPPPLATRHAGPRPTCWIFLPRRWLMRNGDARKIAREMPFGSKAKRKRNRPFLYIRS